MISISKLLGGSAFFGDTLRYDKESSKQQHGTRPGAGPVVVWNATKTCNLECVHCYADAAKRRYPGELTTDEAIKMIDDLAAFKVPALLMSGGEPLVRPDIMDLAEYSIKNGVRVTFSTNGTIIDEKTAKRLFDIGVTYVGISVDGTEATHDKFRGKAGAYKETIRGIRNCRAAGLRVGVRFTVTGDNAEDLPSIYRLVEEEGIGRLCIYHLVYSGRGSYLSGIDLDTPQTRGMMNGLISQVDRWNKNGSEIEVLTVDNHADGPYTYLWLREQGDPRADQALALLQNNGGNRSGVAIGCVDSFGFVHIDQFTPTHIVGSVRQRKFSEIWTDPNNELLAKLRNRKELLQGKCSSCRWLSCCNGNFRTRAEAATGDLWQPDPACYLLPEEIAVAEAVTA